MICETNILGFRKFGAVVHNIRYPRLYIRHTNQRFGLIVDFG